MSKIKSKYLIFMLVLLTTLVLFGCGGIDKEVDSEKPKIPENEDVRNEDVENKDVKNEDIKNEDAKNDIKVDLDKAYEFSLVDIDNNTISLKDYSGKPIILLFWVSWDEYSVKQLETLQNVYPLLEEDVMFLTINATSVETKSEEEVGTFFKEKDFSFRALMDQDGEVTKSYYVGSFPTLFFIDEDGNVKKMYTSALEEDQLLDEVELLLQGY